MPKKWSEMTYEDFKDTLKRGGKCTIKFSWMREGCPTCGCKRWEITNDGWAYCTSCSRGFSMETIMTNRPLEIVDFSNGEMVFEQID